VGGEGAHVREGGHPERRGEAQPPRHPKAARGALLPRARRICGRRGSGRGRREGAGAQLRGPGGEGVALPLLVLEQQPELRDDQGMEPVREGEAPRRRGHGLVRARRGRRGRPARPLLHRFPPPPTGPRVPAAAAGVCAAPPAAPVGAHLPVAGLRRLHSGAQPARAVPAPAGAGRRCSYIDARARCCIRGGGDEVEARPPVRGEPRLPAGRCRRRRHSHPADGVDASAIALAIVVNILLDGREGCLLFGSWTVKTINS